MCQLLNTVSGIVSVLLFFRCDILTKLEIWLQPDLGEENSVPL